MKSDIIYLSKEEKLAWLKSLGHEPIEPANQYCKHCGVALFTHKVKIPCNEYKENV